jgi:transglutaminase-like putative cysteine protease
MSWRLTIRHSTTHRYGQEVSASYNEARVIPMTLPRQMCLEARVDISPSARLFRYVDYWGSSVVAFDLHAPHTELVVHGSSVVETSPAAHSEATATWADLASEAIGDEFAELLEPTVQAPREEGELADVAAEARRLPFPSDAARQVTNWTRDRLVYEPGATDVRTSATEAVAQGKGVCQDFAHVSLVLLRALGIPARYVSGYLHPSPEAELGQTVIGQSHAWVEWWCGTWFAWDPTHGVVPGERHVVLARGRDYADVAPLRGIYHGAPAVALEVQVELTRSS